MSIENILNVIINSFFESIIVLLLYTFIIGQPNFILRNKVKSVLYILVYVIFTLWADTFITSAVRTLIYFSFYIVILSFTTKSNILSSLIAIAIITTFAFILEGLIVLLFMLIQKNNFSTVIDSSQFKLLGGILVRAFEFLIIFLLYRTKPKLFISNIYKKKRYMISTGLLQVYMLCLFIPFLIFGVQIEKKTTVFQLSTLLLCILIVILGIIDFVERDKVLKMNYQFKLQEANTKNMEAVINILRRNHHDIGNHLNTILALTQKRELITLDRINEYVYSINNALKSSFKSYDTGNDYINGLLAVKSNSAFERGIRFEVDFETKLDAVNIADQALISILSNIIDNALQAMEEANADDRFISVSGYIENTKYILSICNNGPAIEPQNLSRVFETGFSTKNDASKEHGFGLYIVKQYVEEHNGMISVSSCEDETEFVVRFPCFCKR